jgi:murein DD-endopeptidase MepM/ murein hydrolase activator NlpD
VVQLQPQPPARLDIAWPTPNRAFFEGRGIEAFIQPTASGILESGLFGGTRKDGLRFHEGIDLKALSRDKNGEPIDPVFAVLPGVVRYINTIPGNSDYGRYIVIEHTGAAPAVYSLYAHLRAVQPGLRVGDSTGRGQRIGTLGRSSSTIALPKAQAHLHFEMGVRVTDNFQAWYDSRGLGGKNHHGLHNGYNLMGFDPLDFFRKWRSGTVGDFQAYFAQMQQAVRVRVVTREVPDFVRRYPSLLVKPLPADGRAIGGWEIACNPTGLPFAWTPLSMADVAGEQADGARIVAYDAAVVKAWRCRSIVIGGRGVPKPGRDLQDVIDMLFK